MSRRFTPVTFFILGGLLVWMLCFLLVYVTAALACARGNAETGIRGIWLVPAATVVIVLLAALATMWLAFMARRHLARSTGSERRFDAALALSLSLFAFATLAWLALPGLLVRPPCAGQPAFPVALHEKASPQPRMGIESPRPNNQERGLLPAPFPGGESCI